MIRGRVNEQIEAIVSITVRGPAGEIVMVETVVDTGYTGALLLPRTLIEQLGLTWIAEQRAMLADGRTQVFDVFLGVVSWEDARVNVQVDAADATPLLGMALLAGHELRIQALSGGAVTIERLA